MSEPTYGRRILGCPPHEILEAEDAAGRSEQFAEIDVLLTTIVTRSFAGDPVVGVAVKVDKNMTRSDSVTILGLDSQQRQLLGDRYLLERQQSRGAWFLPQIASLKVGMCNLPSLTTLHPKFAVNAARDATAATVDLRTNDDALAIWALLIPVFSELFAPVDARTISSKPLTAEQHRHLWELIDTTYSELNIDVAEQLADLRYGGDWSRLRIDGQMAAKQALMAALASQVGSDTIRRWRARSIQALAAQYYSKATSGRPLARSVLTGTYQAALSGLFGGDWLAFLDYLDEQPTDAENILTSLPEPRVYLGGSDKVTAVATTSGLPVDELERILGALLGRTTGTSAVEERVAVMRRWWQSFDHVHSVQESRAKPARGLVEDAFEMATGQIPAPPLYRKLLPADLCDDIDRLWDGITLPRWPERIVSEFHPHHQMALTLGPAIDLWNGVALSCWSACDSYTSRNLTEIAERYRQEVNALADLGFPIDVGMFEEFAHAEQHLGPVQPWAEGWDRRRDGFETVRDIVTRHRRVWAHKHLDDYLRHRWNSEIRDTAREFNRRTAASNKPPTFKQFASFAAPAANHWFNGDLAALYAALGEPSPATTARHRLLLGGPLDFMYAVYGQLGGRWAATAKSHDPGYAKDPELGQLAEAALRYLQLYEALGRPPSFGEFRATRFRWEHLGGEEAGWCRYQQAIEVARMIPSPALRLTSADLQSESRH
ncbi:hypothetical protein [Rhodococcus qingshengii]|uniref:hypothetical protein n=1 Tax=Rhodococcus qingshengii TaxID=334542 RepID=UPI001C5E9650|nr:hypothetical protein [Rhodococcus qingshengii]MBW4818760.1 hypothetical protein [Rhodococcus qingshengii]